MGAFLRLGSFLCFIAVIRAQCVFEPLMITDINKLPTGCQDSEGETHEFGSKWLREDCYSCTCSEGGASCCNTIPRMVEMPEDCMQLVERATCTSKLVLKSDPSVACPDGGASVLK